MWNILKPIDRSYLVQFVNRKGQSSMNAENLAANDSCKRQAIEDLCKTFPNIGISIFFTALLVEAICLRDR